MIKKCIYLDEFLNKSLLLLFGNTFNKLKISECNLESLLILLKE